MNDENKPDIWQLQSQFNIQGLIKALSSDDKNVRRRAAAALRAMGANEALKALRAAYAAEEDTNTRMIIATTIETLTKNTDVDADSESAEDAPHLDQSMVQRLIKRLKSGTPDDIIKAAHHLGDLGDKIAVEPLVLVFNDTTHSIQVRLAVAEALLKLESAPVEVALLANLRHADWHIRRNGAAILGQLRAEWAVQPLAQALNDPHAVVRRTARAALKHIGTPESRKALAQADSSPARLGTQSTTKPTTASGITVKTLGKKQQKSSGMLSKHLEHDESSGNVSTKRLDGKLPPEVEDKTKRHTNVTMPLGASILDQLEALDAENEDEEKKDEDDS